MNNIRTLCTSLQYKRNCCLPRQKQKHVEARSSKFFPAQKIAQKVIPSPKTRNPQPPKISRKQAYKPAQLGGKTAHLATLDTRI